MTWEEKRLYLTIKNFVRNEFWSKCKFVRNSTFMKKAGLCVALAVKPKAIAGIKNQQERMQKRDEWAEFHGPLVAQFVNEKRNYVSRRLGNIYTELLRGGDGSLAKRSRDSGRKVTVSIPRSVVYPSWLPNPDVLFQVVMRDPQAWGYDDNLQLVDAGARDAMDKRLRFLWDKLITTIIGPSNWGVETRCYQNLSTATIAHRGSQNPELAVHASTEALALWIVESNWESWEMLARWEGLEKLEPKYTQPSRPGDPFSGLTNEGVERLHELIQKVQDNRATNAAWIAKVEDRVREMVHRHNGQDEIEDKKQDKRKTPPVEMASEEVCEEKMDYNDLLQW